MLASLGRICFHHRRWVLLAWLVAFVGGIGLGVQVFPRLDTDYSGSTIESFAGFDHLDTSAQYGARVSALAVVPTGPGRVRAVAEATADLAGTPGVARVVNPLAAPRSAGVVSRDGRSMLLVVDLGKDLSRSAENTTVDAVETRLRRLGDQLGTPVLLGGDTLLRRESAEQSQQDTERGELVALPVTLVVMVLLFGGFVAAGIPLLGALCSIAGGLAALYGLSYVMTLDPAVPSVTTVMGLGLSIDYALLIVQRYREERGLGRDAEDAVVVAVTTAGRTISFSALTVATALCGLFVFQLSIFRALGAAGVTVVLVALTVGLTLTPALLATFHRRIRVPTGRVSDDGFFARLARATQRRALLVTVGLSAALLAAGLPFLGVVFQNGGADLLPKSFEARRFAEAYAVAFPARATDPVRVVARVPAQRLDTWAAGVADLPQVASVAPAVDRAGGWAEVDLTPKGTTQGTRAKALVHALRAQRPAYRTWVTGSAAVLVDFQDLVRRGLPWALTILALGTFVLLFLMTGSVLVPLKALVMNTLSLGATFGVLVLVFQDGHGSSLLGFTPTGALETWVPVVVFAFAFGLSMDYEVFLLSRVKELYDSGLPNDKAVEVGLQRSGRIITSAALLVFIVFLGFTSGKLLGIKQMGLALATAVAVDATLVRCLLVPATMTLLGDRNWWAPAWLRRVHDRIGLREHVTPPPLPSQAGPADESSPLSAGRPVIPRPYSPASGVASSARPASSSASRAIGLRRLGGTDELLALLADDFARAEVDPARTPSAWALGGAAGWVTASRRVPGRAHLVALGPAEDAAALLDAVAARPDVDLGSVTLPRDADRHVTAYRLDPRNDWEWFVTRAAPPVVPREGGVSWLDDDAATELRDLLHTWSPRHDAEPGRPGVLRWAGLRDAGGRLLAAAAHTEHRPGVPHLASVVTHGDARGQGLGAAVVAWLTRALLAEGTGWVTLGMYSDNDVARRLYRRLGYAGDHHFTSGRLLPR